MPKLALTAQGVAAEIAATQARLVAGAGTLRRAADARIGATPRELVHKIDAVRLYRYIAPDNTEARIPLLIVYALVNRPDMVDLQAGRSLVEALLKQGFDVYLIDWGEPTQADRGLGLADYILRYLDGCVDALLKRLALQQINLFGICQGGTFSVCYSALRPAKVARLVTTVTPIDFHTDHDMLSHLVRGIDIDALIAAYGNISGDMLNALFLSLKPFRLTHQKYVRLIGQLDDVEAVRSFLRMEQWIFDSPMLSAKVCREFARDFYQSNLLAQGRLEIGGLRVDPANLRMPIFNCYARDDHLVPPASSMALGRLVGRDQYTACELPGGHIGLYVSLRAPTSVPQRVREWFKTPGL